MRESYRCLRVYIACIAFVLLSIPMTFNLSLNFMHVYTDVFLITIVLKVVVLCLHFYLPLSFKQTKADLIKKGKRARSVNHFLVSPR